MLSLLISISRFVQTKLALGNAEADVGTPGESLLLAEVHTYRV